jgi:hypothetical protein
MRVLLLWLLSSALTAGDLRLGRAAVVITPEVGTPMGGSYNLRVSDGVLDDLHAKALVLEQDGVKTAIVACDLVAISAPVIDEARRLIEQSTGLKPEQVIISATHTHSGPLITGRGSRDGSYGGTMDILKKYMAALPGKIAESVRLANASLAPARVSAAIGQETSVSFNRRFLMKDGTIGWNPGKRNPNVVRPAGPIDPEVAVVSFDSPDGKPQAIYVNHALHVAVTSGRKFSSDYPGTMARLLGDVRGRDMLTVFTIGAAGNVNHINVASPRPQGGPTEANRIGTILAARVLRTLERLDPIVTESLRFRREMVQLDLPALQPGDVEKARELVQRVGGPKPPAFLEQVWAFKVLDVAERQGRPIETEVQVITLGDQLAFVGLPGEIFVELGMAVKRASPFPYTIVAELSGGAIGYVPDWKAYPEGNYEPVSARMAPGGGEKLVEAATRLLVELYQPRQRP